MVGGGREPRLLALVRWYDVVPAGTGVGVGRRDVLASHDYVKLKWAVQLGRGAAAARGIPDYQVVAMSSVVQRVYVVPDFATKWDVAGGKEPVFFYVSKSKWERLPKDTRS